MTVRRLNRYEVMQIQWQSGSENVREMILYSISSETFSQ